MYVVNSEGPFFYTLLRYVCVCVLNHCCDQTVRLLIACMTSKPCHRQQKLRGWR